MNESELEKFSKPYIEKMNDFKRLKEETASNIKKMNDNVDLLIKATQPGTRVADQLAASALMAVSLSAEKRTDKTMLKENIAFNIARQNGLKHQNSIAIREIEARKCTIKDLAKENEQYEEQLWWIRFIKYCNTFC
ncbi:MAG: hypothetical protein KAJ03_12405 [Gammaproteobacteria bacterium]|nr:hypothetical protein [Gammaproteobacteria bacterium]